MLQLAPLAAFVSHRPPESQWSSVQRAQSPLPEHEVHAPALPLSPQQNPPLQDPLPHSASAPQLAPFTFSGLHCAPESQKPLAHWAQSPVLEQMVHASALPLSLQQKPPLHDPLPHSTSVVQVPPCALVDSHLPLLSQYPLVHCAQLPSLEQAEQPAALPLSPQQ